MKSHQVAVPMLLCALAAEAWAAEAEVEMKSCNVRAEITGAVATTTVEMVFVNYSANQREASVQFQLPSGAAVHELALWVGGLRQAGEVYPRIQARQIYDSIVNARRDPALLECLGNGTWQLQVFPIPGRGTQKVQFIYSQVLPAENKQLRYLGMTLTPASSMTTTVEYDFSATLKAPGGIKDFKPANNTVGIQKTDDGDVIIGLRQSSADLTKPMEFSFTTGQEPPASATWAGKEGGYFSALLPAPAELNHRDPRPRNYIFVLDASESMRTCDIFAAAQKALGHSIDQLLPQDSFTVVLAGPEPKIWKSKLVPADKENRQAAVALLDEVKAEGGTDLAGALRAAASLAADNSRRYDIIVISDGLDLYGAEKPLATSGPAATSRPTSGSTSRPVSRPPANCRLYGVFPGYGGGGEFSRIAYDQSVYHADGPEHLQSVLDTVVEKTRQADLSDLKVEVDGDNQRDSVCAAYDGGDYIAISGKGRPGQKVSLTLTAQSEGKPFKQNLALTLPEAGWGSPALAKVWAAMWCAGRLAQMRAGDPTVEEMDKLVQLSRQHRVATPATAFLVLEKDTDYTDRGISRQASVVRPGDSWASLDVRWSGQRTRRDWVEPRVAELRSQARELIRRQRYETAVDLLQEAFQVDPSQVELASQAAVLRELIALRDEARGQREVRQEVERVLTRQSWETLMIYGQGPLELPIVPGQKAAPVQAVAPEPGVDAKMMQKLQTKVKVDFKGITLPDALTFLEDTLETNIHTRWAALAAAGIDKNTPLSVRVKQPVTAEKLLALILEDAGGVNPLGYEIDRDVLTVSTKDDLAKKTVTRVYDIRDLLVTVPSFTVGPPIDFEPVVSENSGSGTWGNNSGGNNSGSSGGNGAASHGNGVWAESNSAPLSITGTGAGPNLEDNVSVLSATGAFVDNSSGSTWFGNYKRLSSSAGEDGSPSRQEVTNNILDAIRSSVDPISWRESQGTIGSARELNGMLIIQQTQEAHRQIGDLLGKLRRHNHSPAVPEARIRVTPEGLFTSEGNLRPWVLAVLAKAKDGKLSPFSSYATARIGERLFLQIGGYWLDTGLTAESRVYPVALQSPAAEQLAGKSKGAIAQCLERPYVVVAMDKAVAVCLAESGLSQADNPDVRRLLELAGKK